MSSKASENIDLNSHIETHPWAQSRISDHQNHPFTCQFLLFSQYRCILGQVRRLKPWPRRVNLYRHRAELHWFQCAEFFLKFWPLFSLCLSCPSVKWGIENFPISQGDTKSTNNWSTHILWQWGINTYRDHTIRHNSNSNSAVFMDAKTSMGANESFGCVIVSGFGQKRNKLCSRVKQNITSLNGVIWKLKLFSTWGTLLPETYIRQMVSKEKEMIKGLKAWSYEENVNNCAYDKRLG